MGIDELRKSAQLVIEWHRGFVNGTDKREPYDPLANPGQFPDCVVKLARALLEIDMEEQRKKHGT